MAQQAPSHSQPRLYGYVKHYDTLNPRKEVSVQPLSQQSPVVKMSLQSFSRPSADLLQSVFSLNMQNIGNGPQVWFDPKRGKRPYWVTK